VAIKVVGLRRKHRARLLKRINAEDNHDDQAAAAADDADDDDADDDADDVPTFTTIYTVSQKKTSHFNFRHNFAIC